MANLVSYAIPNLIQGLASSRTHNEIPPRPRFRSTLFRQLPEGLRKRDFTRTLAKVSTSSFGDAFIHSILRDESEEYLAVITKDGVQVFDLDGNAQTVNEATDAFDYLDSVTNARQQLRAVTVADYTFICNLNTNTAMQTATAPEQPRPAAHECLIWIRAANYGQTYRVNVNGTEVEVETPVAPVVTSGGTVTENRISSEEIAQEIADELDAIAGITVRRESSVLWLTSANPITVAASDARANADITAILGTVQSFTELPTIAPIGYQVEVEGDPGNNFDGYYVHFQPRGADVDTPSTPPEFGEGSWLETVSPGVEFRVNADTMPHLLIRQSNGEFLVWPG